ncbi:Transcriptional regulator, XRE family protein [Cupriavidus necator]|uniref:helix-turn-helix domain-containing protein n=1 Tax=Cupriavidus necator TaxID=106590 RepID=UPI003F73C762
MPTDSNWSSRITEKVGKRLAERRKELGLSQATLGERLGLEKESVSRIESGKIAPSLSRLAMFCDALNLSFEELLMDVSTHPSDSAKALIASLEDLSPRQRDIVLRAARNLAALLRDE